MCCDELMDNPNRYRCVVPDDIQLRRHLLRAYHDSPVVMYRGREVTYISLSNDFYWRNMSKHVRNWIRRCPDCIRFTPVEQNHGTMQVRLYEHPFHTLGLDFVGELPVSPNGNKWILTAVCPYLSDSWNRSSNSILHGVWQTSHFSRGTYPLIASLTSSSSFIC